MVALVGRLQLDPVALAPIDSTRPRLPTRARELEEAEGDRSAARVLFHAGPKNRGRNVNIHRWDYLIQVVRLGKRHVRLEFRLNTPYSYFWLNRTEVTVLRDALEAAYGDLESL